MGRPVIDRTGQQFGRWRVISLDPKRSAGKEARWLCRCTCGILRVVGVQNLIGGRSVSCGCYRVERSRKAHTIHGHARRSLPNQKTTEYRCWQGLHRRCSDPKHPSWRNYGARGISVCQRWASFICFLEDMGLKPHPSLSIDRINPNGHYEPTNCRWATRSEQRRNTRKRLSPTEIREQTA